MPAILHQYNKYLLYDITLRYNNRNNFKIIEIFLKFLDLQKSLIIIYSLSLCATLLKIKI